MKMRSLTWSQVSSFKLSSALQTTRSLLDYGTCETWLVVVHLMAKLGDWVFDTLRGWGGLEFSS